MKTKLLYLTAFLGIATNCNAQWATTLDINFNNGEKIQTIISDGGDMDFFDCDEDLEMVDLGLSVKWAKKNVGASTITETGDYFYWGDTIKIAEDSNHECYENYYGRLKNHIAKTKFDVAYKYSGKNWRMPTIEEFQELIEKCEWQKVSFDGIQGYLVTGPNKNYIFLPFTGHYYKDQFSSFEAAMYWTDSKNLALSDRHITNYDNVLAIPVRPVYDESGDKWLSSEEYIAYNDDIHQALYDEYTEPYIFPTSNACQNFISENEKYFLDEDGADLLAKSIVYKYFSRHLNEDMITYYSTHYTGKYECSDGKAVYTIDEIADQYLHYLLSQQGCIDLSQPDLTTNVGGTQLYTKNSILPLSFVKFDTDEYNYDGYYAVRPTTPAVNPYIAYEVPFPVLAQSKYTINITMAPDAESEEPLPNYFRILTFSKINSGSNMGSYPTSGTSMKNPEDGKNFFTSSARDFYTVSFDYETKYATNLLIQLQANVTSKNTSIYSRTFRIAEISINCENEYITSIDESPQAAKRNLNDVDKYDLTGRKIEKIESNGVYIIDGNKVLFK